MAIEGSLRLHHKYETGELERAPLKALCGGFRRIRGPCVCLKMHCAIFTGMTPHHQQATPEVLS